MAVDEGTTLFEGVYQNVRNAAEANLKMQQDVFRQWFTLWPGLPKPQEGWVDKVQDFQKECAQTISGLARKHREVLERQYQAALESLDEALRVTESKNPAEFRQRTEQLCRKTLDCMREVSEAQMNEFQEAVSKWTDTMLKTGT